jgi:hypothetical protein
MLADAEYAEFLELVEGQSLRQLRRYLDYGKRTRQGGAVAELHQWLGRILLDRDSVYGLEDKASAFEIAACEWLAGHWDELNHPEPAVVTVAGAVDKVLLVRLLVSAETPAQRTGLAQLFRQRYGRIWSWISERASQLAVSEEAEDGTEAAEDAASTPDEPESLLFIRFLEHLERLAPLPAGAGSSGDAERLRAAEEREERLHREIAATTNRAERAATRGEGLQEEVAQLRRAAREEGENGEKLREERTRRIRIERQARDVAQELERLKNEYLRLDARMRESAQREGGGLPLSSLAELAKLADADPGRLLGLGPDATAEDLARTRRRFAAAFHSDRISQLPPWVAEVFDQLLSLANAACDRARR